jgi:hypothetical protein
MDMIGAPSLPRAFVLLEDADLAITDASRRRQGRTPGCRQRSLHPFNSDPSIHRPKHP